MLKSRSVDLAYHRIRADLCRGRWASGAHLREAEISTELEMSRTPVREAMRRLAAEGMLDFEPHLGATVPGWTRNDVEEIFRVRLELEGLAAELAADHASAEHIEQLAVLARRMAEEADGRETIAGINAAFHRLLVQSSGNRRLERIVDLVTELPLVVRTFANYDERAMQRSLSHHFELVEALRAQDGAWARAVMQAHLRAGREVMLKELGGVSLDGGAPPLRGHCIQ